MLRTRIGILLAIVFTSYPFFSFGMQLETPLRGLLIFLDDSEEKKDCPGALANSLMSAIAQKAGPIIASGWLLSNVFSNFSAQEQAFDDVNKLVEEHKLLMNKLAKKEKFTNEEIEKFWSMKLRALNFNENEWVIKEINDQLFLLITKEYLMSSQINLDPTDILTYTTDNISTKSELILGLKVNHMKTVSTSLLCSRGFKNVEYSDYFMEALCENASIGSDSYNKNQSKIFCTHADYKNLNVSKPIWSIFISGHGMIQESIVNLTIKNFKRLLAFLESEISCRFFMYSSCYAAGSNSEILYNNNQRGIQQTYPFAIITLALTDAPTATKTPEVIVELDGILKFKSMEVFNTLLRDITSPFINYQSVVKNFNLDQYGARNQPQIKLPGTEWFSAVDADKKIISIGSILAKSRDSAKGLSIKKFFKKSNPNTLLIYSHNLPFKLNIDVASLKSIVSMIPGDAVHMLKGICSDVCSGSVILNMFFDTLMYVKSQKVFFIKEIKTGNCHWKNVIVRNNQPEPYAFFLDGYDNNKLKKASKLKLYPSSCLIDSVVKENELRMHQNIVKMFLDRMEEKVTKFDSLNQIYFSHNSGFEFFNSCIINEVTADDRLAKAIVTFNIGKTALKNSSVVWIKKLDSLYSPQLIKGGVEGLKMEDPIVITNVIVDPQVGGRLEKICFFFTYNGKFYQNGEEISDDYMDTYIDKMKKPLEKQSKSHLPSSLKQRGLEKLKRTVKAQRIRIDVDKTILEAQNKASQSNLSEWKTFKEVLDSDNYVDILEKASNIAATWIFDTDVNKRWSALDLYASLLKKNECLSEALEVAEKGILASNDVVRQSAFNLFKILIAVDKTDTTRKKIKEIIGGDDLIIRYNRLLRTLIVED